MEGGSISHSQVSHSFGKLFRVLINGESRCRAFYFDVLHSIERLLSVRWKKDLNNSSFLLNCSPGFSSETTLLMIWHEEDIISVIITSKKKEFSKWVLPKKAALIWWQVKQSIYEETHDHKFHDGRNYEGIWLAENQDGSDARRTNNSWKPFMVGEAPLLSFL